MGTDTYCASEDERLRFEELVRDLSKVSVNDESTRLACERFGVDAKLVLDPVFICDPSHYDDLIERSRAEFPSGFVMTYMMHRSLEGYEAVLDACGIGSLNVGSSMSDYNVKGGLPNTNVCYVENWLKCIKSASLVLTDSYYAVAFAIMFRRPFIAVSADSASNGRVKTLLTTLGLEDRLFYDYGSVADSSVLHDDIDYDEVHRKLDELLKDTSSWILDSLV